MIAQDMTKGNANKYPDKTAVIVGNTRYTFKQLHERVNSLANALSDIGLKKGNMFAVCAGPCAQHPEILYAAIETGMPLAVLNSAVSKEGLVHQLNTAKLPVIIFDEETYDRFESLRSQLKSIKHYIVIGSSRKGTLNYDELISSHPPLDLPEVNVSYDDLVWVTSSSGTTGLPKLIMRSYETSLALGLRFGYGLQLTGDDVFFNIGSPSMAFCLSRVISYLGATFIMANEFSPEAILRTIETERVTKIFCGAIFVRGLINYPDSGKYDHSTLRRVITVGAPLDVEEWQRAIEMVGNIFVNAYGSVEDTPTCYLYPEDIAREGGQINAERLKSTGRETPGAHIRVIDDQGNDVQPGRLGELVTRGETLMKGYYNEPEKTREVIKGGFYHTGDLVKMDEEGYIYFAGRKSDVIAVSGEMVLPQEIEGVISRIEGVSDVTVIGLPDDKLGQTIRAVIVTKEKEKITEADVIRFCEKYLPDFAVPRSVDFVESLPRGPSGKILKNEVMNMYLQQKRG